MNLVVRRRLAAGAVLASSALVAGVLLAPSGNAASGGLQVIPSSVVNTETAQPMSYKSSNVDFSLGSSESFSRIGGGQPFTASTGRQNPATDDPNVGTGTKDFSDVDGSPTSGGGVGIDGPADAGVYNVGVTGTSDPTGVLVGGGTDNCTSCFTVLSPGAVSVTGATPTSYRPNATGNLTIAGNNFERGSRIEFLFADGSVDPLITANTNPIDYAADPDKPIIDKISTRKSLQRTAHVDVNDAPGARGIRVTNLDGNSSSCTGCFFVAGPPLSSISPTGGVNDPGSAAVTVTFSGANVTANGTPRLEFTGNPGGSTRDALSLDPISSTPSNGTSVTGTFDLSNAAPGAYQGVVRDKNNGITNACEQPACSLFTVVQQSSRKPPTVTGLDRDPNTAGNQKDQPTGTTRTFDVAGTNFSKGVAIALFGTGTTTAAAKITVTGVEFVSPTLVQATIQTATDATAADYDVKATLTDGTASAVCSKCYTVGAATSPSPSPSGTATPCPSSSPSDTATSTISPSPGSPSPSSGSNGCAPLTISVSPKDIVPTQASTVSVHGSPNQAVQVYAYSRPSTTYGLVRSGTTNAAGNISWTVTPGGNTRLYAHYTSGNTTTAPSDSKSTVITVHTSLSLSAYRDGVRKYHFQGTNLPRRAGQLITLYRYAKGANHDQFCVPTAESDTTAKDDAGCTAIITSQAKTGPNNTWRIDRTFNGNGQFYFVVRTSENINNGRGHSNQRLTVIK